ncbi:MAM and LDL-receptor class A domain-containing protein 1-like isoform X2 [Oculina patagonica]
MILLVLLLVACAVTGQQLPCGSTPIAQSRVIGGQDAKPGAWPWQIALKRYNRFICGGSLISKDWIVTAAHCVAGSSIPSNYKIVVGDHNRNTIEGTEQEVVAKRIISHPQYNRPSRLNNDIALIELASPVKLSQRVNPVCIPSHDSDIPTGSKCYITGWGKIRHPGSSYHILQQAKMPPIDNNKCKLKISQAGVSVTFTRQMLCAGVENTILSGCHGDSGGPYVCLNADGKTYSLHGAVSWGSGTCNARQIFTVFARLTRFRAWIKQHTGIGDGGGTPPTPASPPLPTTPGNIVFQCSFDTNTCGFVQSHLDKFDWSINSGGTPSSNTGPSQDVSGNGNYAYIETSSPRVQGDNAKLVKNGLSFSTKKCLSFYYHMYGNTMGTLNVYVGQKKIFTKSGNQGNQWTLAKVDITEPGASELIFEGIAGSSYTGDAAIDNIVLKECGGGGGGGCDYGCNFDKSLCGFVQDKNDVFDWTRLKGSTPSWQTGPSADHTTGNGYYMYIETSSHYYGANAKLNSPKLQFSGNMCLKFYYHMYGAGMGTLNVFINGAKVFTESGDKGDMWLRKEVDVNFSGMYAVIFEGIKGRTFQGDIAIDDFLLSPGSCPSSTPTPPQPTTPQVIDCNFDRSMCGFVQDNNDTFDWTRNRGSTSSSNTGPSADHTTGSYYGYYMYIETSYHQPGDNAILISPKFSFSGKRCLQFYYHMYGASMGTLNVFLNGARVFTACGDKGNKWLKAAIDVNLQGMHVVTFEGIKGSSYQSDIAIDDFLLTPVPCTSGSTVYPPATTATSMPPIPTKLKCNFDYSMCGFVQDKNDTFDWTRNRGSTSSSGTGPPGDHTGYGYYMYTEATPQSSGDIAKLTSPRLWFRGRTCVMFYYHMYGADMGTLNVHINAITFFTASGNKGYRWLKGIVNVYLWGIYEVTFEGIIGRGFQSDIAIDDFEFRPGRCPSGSTVSPPVTTAATTPPVPTTTASPPVASLGCNFDQSMCGFVQETNDVFDWTRNMGGTSSSSTGPSGDHTTGNGYYMYIETSWPRSPGDNAKLSSPKLIFRGSNCLHFYYHMYGSTMGALNVTISGNTVFSASGNKGNMWLNASVDVNLWGVHAVTFEGITGSSFRSDLAIDDFLFVPGNCSITPLCSPPCLLVASSSNIVAVDYKTGAVTGTVVSGLRSAVAMDVHFSLGYVFWSDVSDGDIKRFHIGGSTTTIISGIGTCDGLAVDWRSLKLYWTTTTYDKISMSDLSGNNQRTLISSGLQQPRAIALDLDSSFMFWTDWGTRKIERASLNGYQRVAIVTSNLHWNNGIVLDRGNKRIFWVDGYLDRVESVDYNGNNRKLHFQKSGIHPFDVTLIPPFLFFTDWTTNKVHKLDATTGKAMGDYSIYGGRLNGIAAYDYAQQPQASSPCALNNGGCSHFCVALNATGYECVCPSGVTLNPDGKTCNVTTPPPTTVTPSAPPPQVLACDFDGSMCGFVQDKNDTFDWTRKYGSTTSSQTGPSADHTGNGYYMYTEATGQSSGDTAKLNSPKLLSRGSGCLMFYYHMYGASMGTLKVYINGGLVFTESGDKGNMWLKANVDFYVWGIYEVTFEGIIGYSFQSDIAIDDVMLRPGRCPANATVSPPTVPTTTGGPPLPSLGCNFDQFMCGFVQETNDVFDWTRNKWGTPSSSTGPSGDHTTGNGYYMYIETSSPRQPGDNAKLNSPKLLFRGNMCLQFYYHMYGVDVRTLNVTINGKTVFNASGNKGDVWLKANVDFNLWGVYVVTFEGIRGFGFQGDIAIDDFLFVRGHCSAITPPPPTTAGTPPPQGSCGIRPQTRIVGGVAAKHGDWPWQVQLRTTSGFPYCGGSLVYPQWVVTATHCVRGKQPSSIVIRLGAHRRVNTVGTEQDIKVIKVITHPSYHKPVSYSHDIALLKLEKPATLNRYVNLVCLPNTVAAPANNTRCWITGWGRLASGGATPDYLQEVSVPAVSRARCDKAYPGKIHDSMVCAGLDQGGIDSCQGDSGGPMVCETGGKFYLQGATSWGYGCASPGKFGVYAKVKYLLPWLNNEISKN